VMTCLDCNGMVVFEGEDELLLPCTWGVIVYWPCRCVVCGLEMKWEAA